MTSLSTPQQSWAIILTGIVGMNTAQQSDERQSIRSGQPEHIDLLYRYMETRKWTDLVTSQTGFTRMDSNRKSIKDHVLVNEGALVDVLSSSVERFLPADSTDAGLAAWRKTFSDHFPLVIELKVRNADNDVD